jgi:hypothetical protein
VGTNGTVVAAAGRRCDVVVADDTGAGICDERGR